MGNNYQRLFYILKNMDSDVGYPTGYIKVEINCEVAKLQIALSNLMNRQGLTYRLYGIKKDDKQLLYTVISEVLSENGRADIKINTDIHKIGSSKLQLEDINIFAIITQLPDRTASIKCPLVAYTRGEISWKEEFETLLLHKELLVNNVDNFVQDKETESSEAGDNEKPEALAQTSEALGNGEPVTLIQAVEGVETDDSNGIESSKAVILGEVEDVEYVEKDEKDEKVANDANGANDANDATKLLVNIENDENKVSTDNQTEYYTDNKFSISDKFKSTLTSLYNTDKLTTLEQEKMSEQVLADNDILSSVQKNFKDISSIEIDSDKIKNELNMLTLKEELDKSFESFNPFKMKSKNFKWWKINSPGYLNNILFRNNVKTYLLFSPKVMLAHYKYRYIIFGVRNDKHSGKENFICGVPGVYSVDDNPFGNMGSWAQIEGYKPKYGAFGYWIILIDPRTGKLMKIN